MRIAFLIRSLVRAGAEGQLVTLARGLKAAGHEVRVAVFYAGGELEPVLSSAGIRVVDLRKTGRWDVRFLGRLARYVKEYSPDVLYGFMPGANLAGLTLKPWVPVVWGIRDSSTEVLGTRGLARASVAAQQRLANLPALIIANSHAGRDYNVRHGFPANRTLVIPNGIDTDRFAPDAQLRARAREAWGIRPNEPLVGLVARLDPTKDHPSFVRAAARVAACHPHVRFVCVGGGPEPTLASLRSLARSLALGDDRLIWAGHHADMPAVHNALDIACSTSVTEAFPNALAEAMSCGTPCVVTDVGDSARIVGATGVVVPAAAPSSFADALLATLARLETSAVPMREAARSRVVAEYGLESCVRRTTDALQSVVKAPRNAPGEILAQPT